MTMQNTKEWEGEKVTQNQILNARIPTRFTKGEDIKILVSGAKLASADALEIEDENGNTVLYPHSGEMLPSKEFSYSSQETFTIENAQSSKYYVKLYTMDRNFTGNMQNPYSYEPKSKNKLGYAETNIAFVQEPETKKQQMTKSGKSKDGQNQQKNAGQSQKAIMILVGALGLSAYLLTR